MSKSCINIANISDSHIPPHLKELFNNRDNSPKGKAALAMAIKEHIESLRNDRKSLGKQFNKLTSEFEAKTINGMTAGNYTNREATDPGNELGQFNPKSLYKLAKNLVQRYGSVPGAMVSKMLKKNDINKKDKNVLEDFQTNFLGEFTKHLEKIFKHKTNINFRYEDFMQYFPTQEIQTQNNNNDTEGINISSYETKIGQRLSNLADIPIIYKGIRYDNSEAAYQDQKKNIEVLNDEAVLELMTSILFAKLLQHPDILEDIYTLGGSDMLANSTHNLIKDGKTIKTDRWTGQDGLFMQALRAAYKKAENKPFIPIKSEPIGEALPLWKKNPENDYGENNAKIEKLINDKNTALTRKHQVETTVATLGKGYATEKQTGYILARQSEVTKALKQLKALGMNKKSLAAKELEMKLIAGINSTPWAGKFNINNTPTETVFIDGRPYLLIRAKGVASILLNQNRDVVMVQRGMSTETLQTWSEENGHTFELIQRDDPRHFTDPNNFFINKTDRQRRHEIYVNYKNEVKSKNTLSEQRILDNKKNAIGKAKFTVDGTEFFGKNISIQAAPGYSFFMYYDNHEIKIAEKTTELVLGNGPDESKAVADLKEQIANEGGKAGLDAFITETKLDFARADLAAAKRDADEKAQKKADAAANPQSIQYTHPDGSPIVDSEGNPVTTKLDPVLHGAMAATVYEWLATDAVTAIGQNDRSMHSLLGLDSKSPVPNVAAKYLKDTGAHGTVLAKRLGRTILARLEIRDSLDSDYAAKERLEISLGFAAIATMVDMGILERQEVYTGTISEKADRATQRRLKGKVFGLNGLAEGLPLDYSDVFYDQSVTGYKESGNMGMPTMSLFRLVTDEIDPKTGRKTLPSRFQEFSELLKLAPHAFDKLFDNDPEARMLAWDKIDHNQNLYIGKSKYKASIQQVRNLKRYMDMPYVESTATLNIFKALNDKTLKSVIGIIPLDSKLEIRRGNAEGVVRSIVQDYNGVMDYIAQSEIRKEEGKSLSFYIPSFFQGNMRMNQYGVLSPQNSKMHRALFSPSGWTAHFNPFTDKQTNEAFLEAIAYAFDIESGKVGGAKNQRAELDSLLENPIMQAGLAAADSFRENGEMTDEQQDALAAAVDETGNKTHSLKGLVEYARYREFIKNGDTDSDFVTDISKEVDGISNGPIIGTTQLIPHSAHMQTILATLAMGGYNFTNKNVNIDELINDPKLNDAYQRMGQHWAEALLLIKQEFIDEGDVVQVGRMSALEVILGSFTDEDGVVEKVVRDLSKPRTMQTIYGAGLKRQTAILTSSDVINDGVYKKLETHIANYKNGTAAQKAEALTGIETLFNAIGEIDGYLKPKFGSYLNEDGTLNIDSILAFELEDNTIYEIESLVKETYGVAMSNAIERSFSGVIAARQPLTAGIEVSVTIYNTLLSEKVKVVRAMHAANIDKYPHPDRLTNAEMDEILKSLEPVFPRIKTPLTDSEGGGYLPLSSAGRLKDGNNYSLDKEKASTEIKSSFNGVPLMRGYATGIPYLSSTGTSPMVISIQMLDSMTANDLMAGDFDIVNNHDGFSHGIMDGEAVANRANKSYYENMLNYDLGKEMHTSFYNTQQGAKKIMKEMGLDSSVLYANILNDNIVSPELAGKLTNLSPEKLGDDAFSGNPNNKKENIDILYGHVAGEINKLVKTPEQQAQFVRDVINQISSESKAMAAETAANKKEVMQGVAHMAQYPNNGIGYDVPGHTHVPVLFAATKTPIKSSMIRRNDKISNTQESKSIAAMINSDENRLASSADSSVSTKEDDYPNSAPINALNVVETYDGINRLDEQDTGGIKDSIEHKKRLRNLLENLMGKVMNPVELFINTHSDPNSLTGGVYTTGDKGKSGKIFIQTQRSSGHRQPGLLGHGLRLSASEVYAHELVHHVTTSALASDVRLRNQVADVHEETRAAFEEKYGANAFRVFLSDPDIDITDPANAFEVMAAKERWDYIFESESNEDGTYNALDEFITFGVTNENFINELSKVELSDKATRQGKWGSVFEKNLQTTIENIFNKVMDFIQQKFRYEQTSSKANEQIENLVVALTQVNNRKKSALYEFAAENEARLTAFAEVIDNKVVNTVKKTAKTAFKQTKVGEMYDMFKKIPELDNLISETMRSALVWYNDREYGLVGSLVTEMKSNTARMQPFHNLLGKRKLVIDAAGNQAAKTMKDTLNKLFKRELSEAERTSVTKAGLKTDLSSLMHNTSLSAMEVFLSDDNAREAQIDVLLDSIRNDPALNPYLNYFAVSSDSLGYYMVTSRTKGNTVPMMNAHNISNLMNTKHTDSLTFDQEAKAKDIIDQLATLYSLRYVTSKNKNRLAALIKEDPESIGSVLTHHLVIQEEALKELFSGNRTLMQKGYTKAILNPRTKYLMGTKDDQASFEEMGYTMQKSPIPRDLKDPVQDDIYMFKASIGTANDLQSMIASTTQNSAMGADPYQVQLQVGNTITPGVKAKDINKDMSAVMRDRINAMFKAPLPVATGNRIVPSNNMIPKFDPTGYITEVRYMMAESTKDSLLDQQSYFDDVMPSMSRQIIDKKNTPAINAELVDTLKTMYDEEKPDMRKTYLEVSPYSKDKRLRDIYYMLPPKTKTYINSNWGDHKMMVAPDVIDIAFGQRKYTLLEMFGKDQESRNMFENTMVSVMKLTLGFNNILSKEQLNSREGRALTRAKNIEDFMIQLTRIIKDNIVVRSGVVTRANYASNLAYLKSKSMNLKDITELTREGVSGAIRYQKDKAEIEVTKQQMIMTERNPSISPAKKEVLLKNYDRKIKSLNNKLALNPSTALIEAGLMPDVVDDTDTSNIQSPYKHGLNALIDKTLDKLPNKVEKVGRTVFMTDDTEGYRILNNAVKLTDYSARFALYHHYISKGMEHQEAFESVIAEFINFDLPTHRMLEYANHIGLVWFSKYQLRVLKQIKNLLRDRPFTTMATFLIGLGIGGDHIMNSIPAVTKDTLQVIGNPITMFQDSAEGILYADLLTAPIRN